MARLKVSEGSQHGSSTGGSERVRRSPPRRCNQTPLGVALGADRATRTNPEPLKRVRRTVSKDLSRLWSMDYILIAQI